MNRREFLALGAGVFVFGATPFLSRRRRLVRRRMPIMGTIAEFAVLGEDPHAAMDAAVEELVFVDRTMSRFRPDSDVGRINGARGAVTVSPETAAVLDTALRWAEATDGRFDPCLGRVTALWDVTSRRSPPFGFERFAGRELYRTLDLAGCRAIVRDPDVAVDLGGIAKGYAVDRAAQALRSHGFEQALVNVGGDLVALGDSPDGDPWRIGVVDPADPSRIVRTVEVRDEAVATSGDYERFFDHGGRRYHHILDPERGAPRVTDRHSVTVIAASCLVADAAATACFGAPQPEAILRGRARIA